MPDIQFIAELTLALAIGYIFTAMYLLSHPHPEKSHPTTLPEIAIVVAMRNEENTIASCLQSLENQNYPNHLFKVYLADDRSTDNSVEIARPFLDRNENFHLISIEKDNYELLGKMNVLCQALEQIKSEIILITDADCQVPQSWINTYVDYFDENTGMVSGLTVLEPLSFVKENKYNSSIFAKIQTLDWIFLQSIAAATSNANLPVTVLGNNFGFRFEAYHQIGTFKKLGFSPTEDFSLMRAIEETGSWKIKHTLDPSNTIFSYPVKNFKEFFEQRKRWIIGGKGARLWGYFIMGLSFAAHLSILFSVVLMQWKLSAALGIGLIIGIDYFILKRELKKQELNHLKKYFALFEIFYIFYTIIFGLIFPFNKKVTWKNRTLKIDKTN